MALFDIGDIRGDDDIGVDDGDDLERWCISILWARSWWPYLRSRLRVMMQKFRNAPDRDIITLQTNMVWQHDKHQTLIMMTGRWIINIDIKTMGISLADFSSGCWCWWWWWCWIDAHGGYDDDADERMTMLKQRVALWQVSAISIVGCSEVGIKRVSLLLPLSLLIIVEILRWNRHKKVSDNVGPILWSFSHTKVHLELCLC